VSRSSQVSGPIVDGKVKVVLRGDGEEDIDVAFTRGDWRSCRWMLEYG
jgi:hypothetical protein